MIECIFITEKRSCHGEHSQNGHHPTLLLTPLVPQQPGLLNPHPQHHQEDEHSREVRQPVPYPIERVLSLGGALCQSGKVDPADQLNQENRVARGAVLRAVRFDQ